SRGTGVWSRSSSPSRFSIRNSSTNNSRRSPMSITLVVSEAEVRSPVQADPVADSNSMHERARQVMPVFMSISRSQQDGRVDEAALATARLLRKLGDWPGANLGTSGLANDLIPPPSETFSRHELSYARW